MVTACHDTSSLATALMQCCWSSYQCLLTGVTVSSFYTSTLCEYRYLCLVRKPHVSPRGYVYREERRFCSTAYGHAYILAHEEKERMFDCVSIQSDVRQLSHLLSSSGEFSPP